VRARLSTHRAKTHKTIHDDDECRCGIADGLSARLLRLHTSRLHNLWWSEPHNESQAKRNQQQIIEVANDRDKVWNEVNGAECIRCNENRQSPNKNGCARIAGSEIHREGVLLELLGLSLK
jgi:hypothetical protein